MVETQSHDTMPENKKYKVSEDEEQACTAQVGHQSHRSRDPSVTPWKPPIAKEKGIFPT